MSSPITFMCRRARLIRGETQAVFAIHMRVDQASVSRWETERGEPDAAHLAEIRRIITTAEPCHSLDYVRTAPTIKYICAIDDFHDMHAASKGLLEALGVDREELINELDRDETTQSVIDTIVGDPRWLRGEIAFFEANFKAPTYYGENLWLRTIGAPRAEARAVLWEGVLQDEPLEFSVKLTPFDKKDDDA